MKQTFLLLLVLSYFLISCSSSSETDDLPIYKRISGEWIIEYKNIEAEDIVIDTVSVMTSGNLLNLVAFKKTGKFNEKYFIDYVDHEYCFRLQRKGFCIKIFKGSVLLHKLGNMEIKKFSGSTVCFTNHNYIRRYYMTRNRLDLAYNYLFSFPEFISHILDFPSQLPVRILVSSGEKATDDTSLVWPLNVCSIFLCFQSHSSAVSSAHPVRIF